MEANPDVCKRCQVRRRPGVVVVSCSSQSLCLLALESRSIGPPVTSHFGTSARSQPYDTIYQLGLCKLHLGTIPSAGATVRVSCSGHRTICRQSSQHSRVQFPMSNIAAKFKSSSSCFPHVLCHVFPHLTTYDAPSCSWSRS